MNSVIKAIYSSEVGHKGWSYIIKSDIGNPFYIANGIVGFYSKYQTHYRAIIL